MIRMVDGFMVIKGASKMNIDGIGFEFLERDLDATEEDVFKGMNQKENNAMLEAIERGYFGDNPLRVYAETLRSARGWSRRNLALVFIRRDRRHEHGTFNGAPYTVCVETYRAWICSPLIEDVVEITGDLEKLNFDVLRVIFSKCLDR
jgi:hypothetical protein